MKTALKQDLFSELTLSNPEPTPASRVGMVSLPIPLNAAPPAGIRGLATQTVDVAWWPPSRSGAERVPRRRLMYVLDDKPFADTLRFGRPAAPQHAAPVQVALRDVHKDYQSLLPHHSSELVLAQGPTEIGIRMGLRWRTELHWWQWVRLTPLWSGPVASAYRVGGAIDVVPTKVDDVFPKQDERHIRRSQWLHRQNWLFGEIYLICFANGVVQLHCRHVNGHYFDEGRDQKEITPVIGFTQQDAAPLDAAWTGTEPRCSLGPVRLNLTDCATLVSEAHPGAWRTEDGVTVFQPYKGIEIGGNAYKFDRDDGLFVDASQRLMPRGVARTVRFALSLGKAAPVVTRFTVPEWWYAISGDLWPDDVLPVHDAWDTQIDAIYERQIGSKDRPGRFDDGITGLGREGEMPYVQFTYAHRTGNPEHWRRAVRDAYHIADLAFDHATETMRMHNYPFDGSVSVALFRTMGMLYGHLETGDPYLRECAESASLHFFCMDRHVWPRFSYGRDAMGVRGLVFLADYLGSEQYRQWAREALSRVIQCQLPGGGYNDQGGGTGIHAVGQLPVKPWMANMATNPVIDYVERWPDDPALWDAAIRFGDFMLQAGTQPDGSVHWPYQVSYGGTNYDPWKEFFDPGTPMAHLPDKGGVVESYEARALNVLTRRTRNPDYFDSWVIYFERQITHDKPQNGSMVKGIHFLPYAQAHAWNARWRAGLIEIDPLPSRHRTELTGTIQSPRGPVTVTLQRPDPARPDLWKVVKQSGPRGVQVVLSKPTIAKNGRRGSSAKVSALLASTGAESVTIPAGTLTRSAPRRRQG